MELLVDVGVGVCVNGEDGEEDGDVDVDGDKEEDDDRAVDENSFNCTDDVDLDG